MLIVFVALVYLANAILGLLPDVLGAPLTLQRALGWVMAPVCWLMGIPWSQAVTAGGLMGIKTILNEFVAYLQLAALPDGALDPRSRLIMLFVIARPRLLSACSERNALPRGRPSAAERLTIGSYTILSHLWLSRSVIASAPSSDPDGCRNIWFVQQGGVDEDDAD